MRGVLGFVLGAAAVATGVAHADPCAVTIAYAPDDVRVIVAAWVAKEPRCGTGTLEVRIVRTDGGLYLFARDQAGQVRERVVPDADSAGVLVASWLAADVDALPQLQVQLTYTPGKPIVPVPFVPPPPRQVHDVEPPPLAHLHTIDVDDPGITAVAPELRAATGTWLAVSGLVGITSGETGVRGEVDHAREALRRALDGGSR